jgi:hypothetical protein
MSDETDSPDIVEDEAEQVDFNAEMENLVEGAAGLFESLRDIFMKSKQEVVRGAKLGKVRIDVFQLRKDREHFLQRLGEEVYELLQSGEIAHDDLVKPFGKLSALDEKIAEYETEMAKIAEEVAERAEEATTELDAWAKEKGFGDAPEADAAAANDPASKPAEAKPAKQAEAEAAKPAKAKPAKKKAPKKKPAKKKAAKKDL